MPCLLASIALAVMACTSPTTSLSPLPAANLDATGILLVAVGEQVQPGAPTEELAVVLSRAYELAEANGADLGYPWFDVTTGEVVLSAVNQQGRQLLEAAGVTVPYRIRAVPFGFAQLQRIQEDVTHLRSEGVPGAELIFGAGPDQRDNRTLIMVSAMSRTLLDALAARFPVGAIAVRAEPGIAP